MPSTKPMAQEANAAASEKYGLFQSEAVITLHIEEDAAQDEKPIQKKSSAVPNHNIDSKFRA